MTIDYRRRPETTARRSLTAFEMAAYGLAGYFALSTVTLPLARHVWVGDLPVFAVVQLPKTLFAGWVRTGVVMPLIRHWRGSPGSFSPDYGRAGPWALVAAYLVPLAVVWAWWAVGRRRLAVRPALVLLAAAAFDLLAFELFIHAGGLSIY